MKTLIQALAGVVLFAIWGCASSQPKHLTAEELIKVQQAQPTITQPTATFPEPTAAASNAPTAAVPQTYPIDQTEHWIAVVLDRGARVKLEDGSLWEIARSYQTRTMYWLVSDKVVVRTNPDDQYPFTLVNNTKQMPANARLTTAK